jgi:hypothetical protein
VEGAAVDGGLNDERLATPSLSPCMSDPATSYECCHDICYILSTSKLRRAGVRGTLIDNAHIRDQGVWQVELPMSKIILLGEYQVL